MGVYTRNERNEQAVATAQGGAGGPPRLPLNPPASPQHQEQAQQAGSAGLVHGGELQQSGEGRGKQLETFNQRVKGRRKLL